MKRTTILIRRKLFRLPLYSSSTSRLSYITEHTNYVMAVVIWISYFAMSWLFPILQKALFLRDFQFRALKERNNLVIPHCSGFNLTFRKTMHEECHTYFVFYTSDEQRRNSSKFIFDCLEIDCFMSSHQAEQKSVNGFVFLSQHGHLPGDQSAANS